MAVLERSALAESPLADLHAIASELGVDGFRRLRKDDLIDAILARQDGEDPLAAPATEPERNGEPSERPRRRRGGRGRSRTVVDGDSEGGDGDADEAPSAEAPEEERPSRRPREERRPRSERAARAERAPREERGARESRGGEPKGASDAREPERVVEGVVELLPNGSGFVRVVPPEASDGDAYVSAAQVRRCELVAGDRVSGPVRPPRRSERHPSLVRVDTINGAPADEVVEGVRFDELAAAFPSERFVLGAEDPTVQAIEFLTPIGRGSRVTIAGPARAGKSEALRRLAAALAALDGVECALVLAGVRPEEIAEAAAGPVAAAGAVSFAGSADAQSAAVEQAIEHGKRVAARGGDAVVLVDTLDGLHPPAARKALAAARNIVDGGSLTVIATASAPLGGETTVVALDAELAGARRFPALDLLASGTLRPELLVGDAGAEAIAEARAEAAE
jgi:transcription termination factor Rho